MAKGKRHSGLEEAKAGSLSVIKTLLNLSEADRLKVYASFGRDRVVCPVCEARRLKAAARTRRWRERKKQKEVK